MLKPRKEINCGESCMAEEKKSIAEEFDINNFIDKKKEHANRWANQHRWRNGGRHISSKVKGYLKKKRKLIFKKA